MNITEVSTEGWNNDLRQCVECGREFDMFDEIDAAEWAYGHDCE